MDLKAFSPGDPVIRLSQKPKVVTSNQTTNDSQLTGAHNPERATPILGLYHGVFTDQFIFRHILGHFSRENRISTMSISEFKVIYQKGNLIVIKRQKISFLCL